ncbi:MAG: hypothetical protein E7I45_11155 [Eikenella corrodens]|jgi:hypothetical protein|uniref:hypothetical protein n=1 Tax=Eikenella corrodens TaxID=539 RepID=UPI002914997B|nr:hypothetical protein [Eikenella corrodens]MDU4301506.1 hypothetical protein [Eikenella corrodens]
MTDNNKPIQQGGQTQEQQRDADNTAALSREHYGQINEVMQMRPPLPRRGSDEQSGDGDE